MGELPLDMLLDDAFAIPRQLSQGLRGNFWQSDGVRGLHADQCQSGRVDGEARRIVLTERERGSAALG